MTTPAHIVGRCIARALAIGAFALTGAAACADDSSPGAEWVWDLPAHFPEPNVPADNPMSVAKVELGRRLFYDTRLSGNQTQSCASCHDQARAFTDGRPRGVGSTGEVHPRSAMALTNIAYTSRLTWANPLIDSLEVQALGPMFGETPVELGMSGREDELRDRLAADPDYVTRFAEAFPEVDGAIEIDTITKAIAAFERTLISGNSPYDRLVGGDPDAMSDSAERGMRLFLSERLECFHCHGGFNFSDSNDHAGLPFAEVAFHNTGLYNLDGAGAYPPDNHGIMEITGLPSDMGRFRAPSLRNIAVTAPYFHDGSAPTLDDVISHYERGGRRIDEGPNAGDGAESPLKNDFVSGFIITAQERADLIAFLEALTDEAFLNDPTFANPSR